MKIITRNVAFCVISTTIATMLIKVATKNQLRLASLLRQLLYSG